MQCSICHERRTARQDTVCRTCRRFIAQYIDAGLIQPRPVPAVADVALVMRELGIDQRRTIIALGGLP
ncbi:MAG TPA: hypothetical protein VFB73_07090 [Chloroflexota bacterium]|nr:hypothetical protein [Chloroflexota bacterium]